MSTVPYNLREGSEPPHDAGSRRTLGQKQQEVACAEPRMPHLDGDLRLTQLIAPNHSSTTFTATPYPHSIPTPLRPSSNPRLDAVDKRITFEVRIENATNEKILVGKCLINNSADLGSRLHHPTAGWGRITALSLLESGVIRVCVTFHPANQLYGEELPVYCMMNGRTTLTMLNTLRVNPTELALSPAAFAQMYKPGRKLHGLGTLAGGRDRYTMPKQYLELRKRQGYNPDAPLAERYQVVEITT